MQELVSQREFARRLEVSPPAVGKAIKNGRIFGTAIVGSKLDFAIAEAQFKQNCDISKKRKTSKTKQKPQATKSETSTKITQQISLEEIKGNNFLKDEPEEDDFEESSSGNIESELNRQRARKEKAMADKAELQVKIMRGELIEVEKVNIAVFELFREERDHWLKLPARASGDMSSKLGVDKHKLKQLLTQAVKDHLNEKVQEISKDNFIEKKVK